MSLEALSWVSSRLYLGFSHCFKALGEIFSLGALLLFTTVLENTYDSHIKINVL